MINRDRFRSIMKYISWAPVVLISVNIEKLAEDAGWDRFLSKQWSGAVTKTFDVLQSAWVQYPALLLLGIAIGAYADLLLRKNEVRPASPEQLQKLGRSAVRVADEIGNFLGAENSLVSVHKCLSEIYSLLIALDRAGFQIPLPDHGLGEEQRLHLFSTYLYGIGPLLRDGHIGAARDMAASKCLDIDSIEPPARRSPKAISKPKRRRTSA